MSRLRIMLAVAAVAAWLAGLWVWRSAEPDPGKSTSGPPASGGSRSTPASAGGGYAGKPLDLAFGRLREMPAPDEARRSLAALRANLEALPAAEAVAAIRSFLASGKDQSSGLSFEIRNDGSLAEWPSFRTFLLDLLADLDPAAAAAVGREILAQATTPDEWALALRNIARDDPSATTAGFLRAKTEELISNPAWQANPSIGYLNAFDVLVHLEATASTPMLSGLVQRKDRKDLAHAGFLTLDRLVQRQPADMLARLAADRALSESRPEMVAQQFARADLRDPAQQTLVASWLLDPARSSTELRAFAGVYPNNNRFVSRNLLSSEAGTTGRDLAAHDREALQVIDRWAGDPGFAPIRDHLAAMISRLDGFVGARESVAPTPSPE